MASAFSTAGKRYVADFGVVYSEKGVCFLSIWRPPTGANDLEAADNSLRHRHWSHGEMPDAIVVQMGCIFAGPRGAVLWHMSYSFT